MKEQVVKIISIEKLTHNVKRFFTEKPKGYKFITGQAAEIAINKKGWVNEKRPFTITSLNEDNFLEFTVKIYRERQGVTNKLDSLNVEDEFVVSEPFGTISFLGNGTFIAGGAGITPFLPIFKNLEKEGKLRGNKLIFSNKTEKDIIAKKDLERFEKNGLKLINILTREKKDRYLHGRADWQFLEKNIKDFTQHFYICGPIRFVGETQFYLRKLGANPDKLILET